MMASHLILLAATWIAQPSVLVRDADGWIPSRDREESCDFSVPAQFSVSSRDLQVRNDTLRIYEHVSNHEGRRYILRVNRNPGPVPDRLLRIVLDGGGESMARKVEQDKWKILEDKPTMVAGWPAQETVIEASPTADNLIAKDHLLVVVTTDHQFQLHVISPASAYDPKVVRKFFGSFKPLKTGPFVSPVGQAPKSDGSDWVRIADPDGAFTFAMPVKPKEGEVTLNVSGTQVKGYQYFLFYDDCEYRFVKQKFLETQSDEDLRGLVDLVAGELAEKIEVLEKKPLLVAGWPAIELKLRDVLRPNATPPSGGMPLTTILLVVTNDCIYKIYVGSLKSGNEPKLVRPFFDAFKLAKTGPLTPFSDPANAKPLPAGWVAVKGSEGAFLFAMPAKPKEEGQGTSTVGGAKPRSYSCTAQGSFYKVEATKSSVPVADSGLQKMVDTVRDSLARQAKVLEDKPTTVAGWPARRLTLQGLTVAGAPTAKPAVTPKSAAAKAAMAKAAARTGPPKTVMLVVATNDEIYRISVTSLTAGTEPQAVQPFLDAFRIKKTGPGMAAAPKTKS